MEAWIEDVVEGLEVGIMLNNIALLYFAYRIIFEVLKNIHDSYYLFIF